MHIQGWGTQTALQQPTFLSRSSGRKNDKNGMTPEKSDSMAAAPDSDDTQRSELLKKIRQRIQGGFYNNDAVIEDLSFGFAQALDQTL